jgi:hypothetical protein
MNERIKELWEESTVSMWPRPGKFTAGEYDYHLEKFAELIAKEYIENCRDMFIVGSVSWNLLNEKLEHFGVEE